jgi:dUTP pyrophosphatase
VITIGYSRLKERPNASKLVKATPGSAGYDIAYGGSKRVTIKPRQIEVLPTGIKVALPQGYELQVRSRSGLAAKFGIVVLNSPGTIDSDYQGEIGVILFNAGENVFHVEPGMRIAQIVPAKLPDTEFVEQSTLDLFENAVSQRKEGGFGSTGVAFPLQEA